jgi:hypothetical protein
MNWEIFWTIILFIFGVQNLLSANIDISSPRWSQWADALFGMICIALAGALVF